MRAHAIVERSSYYLHRRKSSRRRIPWVRGIAMLSLTQLLPLPGLITPAIAVLGRATSLPGGGDADGNSWQPSLSADGRYLAFSSKATNLVPGDLNGLRMSSSSIGSRV